MSRNGWLWLMGLIFVVSAAFNVRVNSLPRFGVTPAITAELAALLAANGLQTRTSPEPRGPLLKAALRFGLPACDADGFLLAVADTHLTNAHAARLGEITGAVYESHAQRMVESGGILQARARRAIALMMAALGQPAPRHGHTVLVTFMPKDCSTPPPDLHAFWSATDTST